MSSKQLTSTPPIKTVAVGQVPTVASVGAVACEPVRTSSSTRLLVTSGVSLKDVCSL